MKHETLTELLKFCPEKICVEPDILINSDKFISLKAPLLELLLKRDDLSLDEIVVWDNLIIAVFRNFEMFKNYTNMLSSSPPF